MLPKSDVGTQVAIKFLRDYHEFGSRSHLLTALALKAAIDSNPDDDDKKVLAVKLFAEYMSALEDLGAMCVAIRHRDEEMGLIYSFLTYKLTNTTRSLKTSIVEMFKLLQSGNGLSTGLRLPPLSDIISADSSLLKIRFQDLYHQANDELKLAADTYLKNKRALVRAYNKTKHGFVVVNDRHTFQDEPKLIQQGVVWVAAKKLNYNPETDSTFIELFSLSLESSQSFFDHIVKTRAAVMVITEIAATLLEKGVITSAD